MRQWRPPDPFEISSELTTAIGNRVLAELLGRRGYGTPESALAFLAGGIDLDAPGLPDLQTGVTVLTAAVREGQRICVYGDYDTDGVTATALLVGLLRDLEARVSYYIPNRFHDGYGLHARAIEALADEGTDLLLTCDCGIRSVEEVRKAHALGMKVIVTDHHELGSELPAAEAVINPKRLPPTHPCHTLPGVGTAYLFGRQLLQALGREASEADRWIDLVALGIIADVVPLNGANRELARRGLARLNTSPRVGIQALYTAVGLQGTITEEEIGFQIVPRINAAGRMADAALGVKLLLTTDSSEASDLALKLDQLNEERKRLTEQVVAAASAEVSAGVGALLLYRAEWHEGVLGIAAGKLAEEQGIPVFLMTRRRGSPLLVGSARAPMGFALHEALAGCSEHLIKYGGHASAAGFSLLEDRFPDFRVAMLEEVRRRIRPGESVATRFADVAIPLATADRTLYDDLRRAAPFGQANPAPIFFSPGVQLLSSRPIGARDRHLRLVLRDGERSFTGIWWGAGAQQLALGQVDLFYRLGLNRWNGEEQLQLLIEYLDVEMRASALPLVGRKVDILDRRNRSLQEVQAECPTALLFAEGEAPVGAVDRFGLYPTTELILLSIPPSPRILDEMVAVTGAGKLILAWPTESASRDHRFLPALLHLLHIELAGSAYVDLARLAVRMGELEATVRLGLDVLAQSNLLGIDEERGDLLKLRRRTDGRGILESQALQALRRLLGESRAFRRFVRDASVSAIAKVLRT